MLFHDFPFFLLSKILSLRECFRQFLQKVFKNYYLYEMKNKNL